MIVLAALMIARTFAGAPFGIAARPLRRIIAVLPETVGVFDTGSAGIDDHGSRAGVLTGGLWFQIGGFSWVSPSGPGWSCVGWSSVGWSYVGWESQLSSRSPPCQ